MFHSNNPNEIEDFLAARPLIDELERRLQILVSRKDQCVEMDISASGAVFSVKAFVRPATIISWHNSKLQVSWSGKTALHKDSDRVWMVDLFSITHAVDDLRQYMVLDDLAGISTHEHEQENDQALQEKGPGEGGGCTASPDAGAQSADQASQEADSGGPGD